MNTHRKGVNNQNRARKYLLANGFKVVYFIQHSRFSKDFYIDNCPFDGFAIDNENKVWFLQIKTNCYPNIKEYKKLKINWKVMVWWDRKDWKIYK